MKIFKVYTNKRPINYEKMISKLELRLVEIGEDVGGAYMLLNSLNGATRKKLSNFKGIKKVHEFNTNEKENYFKLLVAPNKKVSYNKMKKDFHLELVEIGTSKSKNFWNQQYPFMIVKTSNYFEARQLKQIKNIKKVEVLKNYNPN